MESPIVALREVGPGEVQRFSQEFPIAEDHVYAVILDEDWQKEYLVEIIQIFGLPLTVADGTRVTLVHNTAQQTSLTGILKNGRFCDK
mmetsp:Transcript_42130/g.64614  ORF Transcript_42130/g.64614 Transcript_42130/m.64614 type:complete len:88 (+) Transcript_42130:32-295(+)